MCVFEGTRWPKFLKKKRSLFQKNEKWEYDEVCRAVQLRTAFCSCCRGQASASLLTHPSGGVGRAVSIRITHQQGGAGWGVGLKDRGVEVGVGAETHTAAYTQRLVWG